MLVAVMVPLLDVPRTMICSPTVRSLTLPVLVISTVVDDEAVTVTLEPLDDCTVSVEPFTAVTVPAVNSPPCGPLPPCSLEPLGGPPGRLPLAAFELELDPPDVPALPFGAG